MRICILYLYLSMRSMRICILYLYLSMRSMRICILYLYLSMRSMRICILYLYLYAEQYLHVLQDSKHYMTHSTVQVQSNSQINDIPLTERQRLKDDHVSTSLRFFSLPLGIGPNDRGLPFEVVIRATMYLAVPRIELTSSVFLGKCVTHLWESNPHRGDSL